MTLKWLVIGAGLHGVGMTNLLIHKYGVSPHQVLLVDSDDQPCTGWFRNSRNCGMKVMRSSMKQHVGLSPDELVLFAQENWLESEIIGDRPSLTLFDCHLNQVITSISQRFETASVTAIKRRGFFKLGIETDRGLIEASNVLICIGQPMNHIPHWATQLSAVSHVFAPDFDPSADPAAVVAIVGGGITAAHLALRFSRSQLTPPVLICQREIPISPLDFHPDWVDYNSSKCAGFRALAFQPPAKRRELLNAERTPYKGSMPKIVADELDEARAKEQVHVEIDEVTELQPQGSILKVMLKSGKALLVSRLILATGLESTLPQDHWLYQTASDLRLPIHDGYPVLNPGQRWLDGQIAQGGIYFSGRLAELTVGPVSGNIAGIAHTERNLKHALLGC
jgi:glycine/D-amino acid oxidase-like deaminating enzyme